MQRRSSILLLLGMVLTVGAARGQSLSISGPTDGATDQLLQFEAIATDCAPLQGQYFWQVDSGAIAGLEGNSTIQVVWDSPGTKTLNVSNSNCLGAVGATSVLITAPGTITLGASSFVLSENGGQHQISVLRQGGDLGAAQVSYATTNGTANAGQDYTAVAGTLSWADGDNGNRVVAVPIVDDSVFEEDESFFFTLSAVSGASLGGVVETQAFILDNDQPPGDVIEFSTVLFQAEESLGSVSVTLTRVGTSAGAVSVTLTSSNNTATAPDDFAAVNTTVNWAVGDTTNKTVLVALVNDALEEGTEIADLNLSNPQVESIPANGDVFLGDNDLAQLIIVDDDLVAGSISFATDQINANETDGTAALTLERIGGTEGVVQVNLTVTGGSATLGEDFSLGTQTVNFPDGDGQSKNVTILLVNDSEQEGLETIEVALSVVSGGAGVGDPNVVEVRIEDDDVGPPDTLSFSSALTSISESAGSVQLSVERLGSLFGPASVVVELASGTAIVGQDVAAAAIFLEWANGEGGLKVFAVTLIDDAIPEPTEEVQLSLSNTLGAVLGEPNQATLQIIDDDSGFLNFNPTTLTLSEPDGQGSLSIERSLPASQAAAADLVVSGTAQLDIDFTLSTTRVEWEAGEIGPREINITVLDDQIADPGESFVLSLTNVVGSVPNVDQATVSIIDDDFQLPAPTFQTVDTLDGPRTAIRPGPGNADTVLQVWRETTGNLLFRLSGTTLLVNLGFTSDLLPGIAFDAAGNLWIAQVIFNNSAVLTCLDLTIEPTQTCGQVEVVNNVASLTAVDLSISLDGTMAVTWIEGGHAFLRLFGRDLFPTTGGIDLGIADTTALSTDDLGTTAVAWLDEITGTATARTLRDDGQMIAQTAPLALTEASAFTTGLDLAFNAQGRLILATAQRVDGVASPVRIHSFHRTLASAAPTLELGDDAESVELHANRGGDVLLAYTPSTPGNDSEVILLVAGLSRGPAFVVPGTLIGLALTDSDFAQFTAVNKITGSTASSFEVYEFSTPLATGSCNDTQAAPSALCLTGERFGVTVQWQDFQGNTNSGTAVPITTDSGYHWFFTADNVEVVLKVLDACDFTNTFWVFATGLTNTEVLLVVDDVVSGVTRSFFNPLNTNYAPILDIQAFSTCDVGRGNRSVLPTRVDLQTTLNAITKATWLIPSGDDPAEHPSQGTSNELQGPVRDTEQGEGCTAGTESLCLANQRFQVEIEFSTAQGTNGQGQAGVLTGDTGTFTFFDSNNIEIVIKLIDACSFNDRFWVFAGGLTDVATSLTVTDTQNGTQKIYQNPLNQAFIPILDTDAFATCPP